MTRSVRRWAAAFTAVAAVLLPAAPAWACAGLFAPGADIQLLRTATLAAWHDGVEHYITSFTFSGGGAEVGSIVPLPGIPTSVERGGDWTLQRLERETQPQVRTADFATAAAAESDSAEVILETKIDALDLTVLRGGGDAVGRWAKEHGFGLTPDAPEILDHYAATSPIFMAARFDAGAAEERGQEVGTGTPVHLTIPTERPWVPLRILALGKQGADLVEADVYLLTDERPDLVTTPVGVREGIRRTADRAASKELLDDLRTDVGMGWIPEKMWLTHLQLGAAAESLEYDLTVRSERAEPAVPETTLSPTLETAPPADPEPLETRLVLPAAADVERSGVALWATVSGALLAAVAVALLAGRRRLFG